MGKRLAGTLLALVLLISFGAAYGEEYPVDVSGMKAAVLCSQDGQSIIEYNSAERLEVGGLGRLPLLLAACDKIDGGGLALTDKVTVSREAARVPGPTAFLDAYENAEVSMFLKAAAVICAGDAIYALGEAAYGSIEACAMAAACCLMRETHSRPRPCPAYRGGMQRVWTTSTCSGGAGYCQPMVA